MMETGEKHLEILQKEKKGLGLIGDLDGMYDNFLKHLMELNFIDKAGVWSGGNNIVIFSGDILADRCPEGFKILIMIQEFRYQANKAGGDIIILAGNHEEIMLGFLSGKSINGFTQYDFKNLTHFPKFNGMHELKKYGENREEILKNMRESSEGIIILEAMCTMKLLYRAGNTIHFHSPPSKNMLSDIGDEYDWNKRDMDTTIEKINSEWESALRYFLLGEKSELCPDGIIAGEFYNLYASSFLNTCNGAEERLITRGGNPEKQGGCITPRNNQTYSDFRDAGIDTICHGHDSSIIEIDGMTVINLNRRSKLLEMKMQNKSDLKIGETRIKVENQVSKEHENRKKIQVHIAFLKSMKEFEIKNDSRFGGSLTQDLQDKMNQENPYFPQIESLVTSKGSYYWFQGTGNTQRFKYLKKKWEEPSSGVAFLPPIEWIEKNCPPHIKEEYLGNDPQMYLGIILKYIHCIKTQKGNKGIAIGNQNGKILTRNSEIYTTIKTGGRIYVYFGEIQEDGVFESKFSIPLVSEPTIGYHVLEVSDKEGRLIYHLGDTVVAIILRDNKGIITR